MSWGERSCKLPCRTPDTCDYGTCNVDCPGYIWDGITKPDSVKSSKLLSDNSPTKKDIKEHSLSKYFRRNKKGKKGR